jgi:xanthine/uracil permease
MKTTSWKSRKLGFSVICVVVLASVAVVAAIFPAIAGVYPALVGGITGVAGLYLAGNIAEQHVESKLLRGIPPKEG